MTKLETAYKLGFDAAKNNGECVPFLNAGLRDLLKGLQIGSGSMEIMTEFRRGVCNGLDI